jgi:hypothetical protein
MNKLDLTDVFGNLPSMAIHYCRTQPKITAKAEEEVDNNVYIKIGTPSVRNTLLNIFEELTK